MSSSKEQKGDCLGERTKRGSLIRLVPGHQYVDSVKAFFLWWINYGNIYLGHAQTIVPVDSKAADGLSGISSTALERMHCLLIASPEATGHIRQRGSKQPERGHVFFH